MSILYDKVVKYNAFYNNKENPNMLIDYDEDIKFSAFEKKKKPTLENFVLRS